MISYLLSGWRVFVPDANGQPLYRGRVYFYDASTSEPSAVYQEKEKVTSLGTYVDVDNNGFIPAIWLDANHLYKCVVKRLIQNDPETWQTLWEINDVGNPFITSDTDDGSSTIMVNDISLLRAIDVTSDERPDYVSVAGWFNPGDTGSPMVFRWRAGEIHDEDGHWVKPGSSASLGTWEQILEDELDPRKFGAIPDTGNAVDSALVNCMRYACEPHIQDISDPTIYKPRTVKFVQSGNYKLNGMFDFSQYTMIPAFGGVQVPVVVGPDVFFDGSVKIGQGARIESFRNISNNFIITDKETYLRTSWYGNKLNIVASSPRVVVIDGNLGQDELPLTGRVIINLMDTLPSNLKLTDCVVIDAHDGSLAPTKLNLGDYLIDWIKGSGGTLSRLNFKHGVNNVMKFDGSFAEFINTLNLPEGFFVDNDNFLMQFEGANEKELYLKIKCKLDLQSENSTVEDIKFDRMKVTAQADVRSLHTNIINSYNNVNVQFSSGAYRLFSPNQVYDLHFYDYSTLVYIIPGLPNFSTYTKINLVVDWWWQSANEKKNLAQFAYMGGPGGKTVGEIVCLVNCGPVKDYTISDLTVNGDPEKLYEKSGNFLVLGPTDPDEPNTAQHLLAVIPPFTCKNFKLQENGLWKPVEL